MWRKAAVRRCNRSVASMLSPAEDYKDDRYHNLSGTYSNHPGQAGK